ncbi:class I mannose-6-phosphate isomerase [Pseudoblastomonas halimionae]|uniref:Mannose-6-phosphate isomerase n=1 Tax=Alteriqipengyuania halimionae TaxID=1926630 RepID=A0A6I4TYG0_9SPHN|nr:class I mannose-6-phosphate isomerase [Alteriqipengyuania halimionae]MXP08839.1 mannose-6-phosphate isomerase [Alteriqipengyuania halimionae]
MSAALSTRQVEKVWGRDTLPAPFVAPEGRRIGEIWFEPPAVLDSLLVKYLFTSEKLSVQVHPDDEQVRKLGEGQRGKEECWLVIDADPGATLGIGFDAPLTAAEIRAAALDGSIEQLMTWHPVEAGDFFYIPAGTVHTIGPGVSLIEVQQNCDITYRLYDYGRERELQLDRAVEVANGEPYADPRYCHVPDRGERWLTDGPRFRLLRSDGDVQETSAFGDTPLLVLPLDRPLDVAGEMIAPGGCAVANSIRDIDFVPSGRALLAQPCDGDEA